MNTTSNDQPYTATCDTCGGSHVFDSLAEALEYDETHGDLGHVVNIEAA